MSDREFTLMRAHGCGSLSCIFQKPTAGTNGPCQCIEEIRHAFRAKFRLAKAERKLTDAFEHILLMCEWYSGHHGDAPRIFEEADEFLKRCIDEGKEDGKDG